MKKHLLDLYIKIESPIHIILYFLFSISIIYVAQIPECYKYYSNNVFLRIISFGLIVGTCQYISYIHSLLLALFIVIYISFTPGMKYKNNETFEDLRKIAKKNHRWHDEKVIGEHPELMETEKVKTEAIQS
jgi:hypothetical protein